MAFISFVGRQAPSVVQMEPCSKTHRPGFSFFIMGLLLRIFSRALIFLLFEEGEFLPIGFFSWVKLTLSSKAKASPRKPQNVGLDDNERCSRVILRQKAGLFC
jgi:hypothetical protein